MASTENRPHSQLADQLQMGDRRALARAISLAENDDPAGIATLAAVYPHTGNAKVVGITGPPGAGKSTLVGALVHHHRQHEENVGVISVDPSSPFTQGAVLGDRIRLTEHFLDPGVFIRSMANRGALGGLSDSTLKTALLMDAAGYENIFLETVGVGQAEIDVIDYADTIVLVLIPGSGDSIQALKAGVMEIPDLIVINKADHPLTETMVREVRGVLSLSPKKDWKVPVIKTQAKHQIGIDELAQALEGHRQFLLTTGALESRREKNLKNEVISIAASHLRQRLTKLVASDQGLEEALLLVSKRRLDPISAAQQLVERILKETES